VTRLIIVSGADSAFFNFLRDSVSSLLRLRQSHRNVDEFDIGILDQGLEIGQIDWLKKVGCTVISPQWPDFVPSGLRENKFLNLAARMFLRDLFPGYNFYVWFDSDAWAQTSDFIQAYKSAACKFGAAVCQEDGPGYRKTFSTRKWWVGNLVRSFGVRRGLQLASKKSINIGIVCLSENAPHWRLWQSEYICSINASGRINMDQHAFMAAAHSSTVTTAFLPAIYNWLPCLSTPKWNDETRLLVEPRCPHRTISLIHLAGSDKLRDYKLETRSGCELITPLSFSAVGALRGDLSGVDKMM
jgi:hypothetical protein